MNATARARKSKGDFYVSSLAPINHHRETPSHAMNAAWLAVLFLAVLMLAHRFLAQ